MPIARFEMPDGRVARFEVPAGLSPEQAQNLISQQISSTPMEAPKPPPERTKMEAVTDVAAPFVSGIGSLLKLPGQVYGLTTGAIKNKDFSTTGLQGVGTDLQEWAKKQYSEKLKAEQAETERKVAEAEKEGQFKALTTGLGEVVSSPLTQLPAFVAEQLPQAIPSIIAAAIPGVGPAAAAELRAAQAAASKLAQGTAAREAADAAVKIAAENALKSAVARRTTAQLGTQAVQQGADIGEGSFQEIKDYLIKEKKMSEEQASEEALKLARGSGLAGAGASLLAQRLPGAKAFEKALAGEKLGTGRLMGAATGALKNIPDEVVEELGGKVAQNIAMKQVNPEQSLTAGLGSTAAQAILGATAIGGAAGAIAGGKPAVSKQELEEAEDLKRRQELTEKAKAERELIAQQLSVTKNPLGEITPAELGPVLTQRVEQHRASTGKPPLTAYSLEDVIDALPAKDRAALVAGQNNDLNALIGAKTGYTAETYTPDDLINLAKEKNIDTTTQGFDDFLRRTTGFNDPALLSQPQLHAAITSLQKLPAFKQTQSLPEGSNATRYSDEQYNKAIEGLNTAMDKVGADELDFKNVTKAVETATGLKGSAVNDLLNDATRKGDIVTADKKVSIPSRSMPSGYNVEENIGEEEETADSYDIMRGDEKLFSAPTEEGATKAVESLQRTTDSEVKRVDAELKSQQDKIAKSEDELNKLTIEGKFGTPEYTAAEAKHQELLDASWPVIAELTAKKESYEIPLSVTPVGTKKIKPKTYTVRKGERVVKQTAEREEAEAEIFRDLTDQELQDLSKKRSPALQKRVNAEIQRRAAEPKPEPRKLTPELEQKRKTLEQNLPKLLAKFGLQDVAVKIMDAIDNDAEGSYAAKIIQIALDVDQPVRVLRHESLHALKALGFFTPQQWDALKREAESKWVDKYLKSVVVEVGGQQMTRYEAYANGVKDANGNYILKPLTREGLLEEAIADAFADFDVNKAPPGMMSALLNKLRNFFSVLKSYLNDQGYEKAEDIFTKIEKGELKATQPVKATETEPKLSLSGIGVPLSTRNLMEVQTPIAQQELGLNTKAVRGRFNNVREIAKALNQFTVDHLGRMDRNNLTSQESSEIARAIADEVAFQLGTQAKTGTGLGWYSNNYPKAVKRLASRFPELSDSKHARSVFSALVAVTSNGEKVNKNIDNAITLYSKLRDGKPLVAMGNRRATALENNLKMIQDLLNEHGTNFEKVLLQEITVKEMNARLREMGEKSDGSYLANTTVPAAAVYFGPKLGAFYANLSGSEGYLTMDLWWTRSINRMRGLLMPQATEASINKFRDMMDMPSATRDEVIAATIPLRNKYEEYGYTTELEHLAKSKEPAKKDQKQAWFKKAKAKAGAAYDQLLFEHNLEKMANTIYKNEFEMLEEAPFTATDRKFMYDAGRKAQDMLRKEGIDLTLADIQAALWYYEKRLYEKLSGRKADDIGYEEAIIAQSGKTTGRARPSVVFSAEPDRRDESRGEVKDAEELRGKSDYGPKYSLREAVRSYRGRNEAQPETHTRESIGDGEGIRVLGVKPIARYKPVQAFKDIIMEHGFESPVFYEISSDDAQTYADAIQASKDSTKFGAAVYVYPVEDYAKMRLFLTQDGKAGVALKGDDIVSVFSGRPHKGSANSSLQLAIQNGGRRLDAFDTVLPTLYHANGFKAVGRMTWNEDYKPDNWDKTTFEDFNNGEPDVVYMSYDPDNNETLFENPGKYYDDPDALAEAQAKAVKRYFQEGEGYGSKAQIERTESLQPKLSLKTVFRSPEAAENAAYKKAPPTTEAFKRWFGKSKVVEEGRPMVMYHASPNEFSIFSEHRPIFVSPDPYAAEFFAAVKRLGRKQGKPYMYPLWVRAENPFDFENPDHIQQIMDYMVENHTSSENANRIQVYGHGYEYPKELASRLANGEWRYIESANIQDALKALGFDSFYVLEGNKKNLAVFDANQVKSVTGNLGDYSESKDIRFSLRTVPLSPDEQKYFDTVFDNKADLADFHEYVPSAELRVSADRMRSELVFNEDDLSGLDDYLGDVWAGAKKQYGGEGASSLPKSFSSAGNKFLKKARDAESKFSLRKAPETPEFKRWFVGSKVVDEDGEPMVMYHASTNFEGYEFKQKPKANRTGNPDGYYFSPSPSDAADYARDLEYIADRIRNPEKYDRKSPILYAEGAEVIPVYLSIKNPYDYKAHKAPSREMIRQYEKELRADNPRLGDDWINQKLETFKEGYWPSISFPTDAMTRVIKAGGYDGMKDGRHWVAFEPQQIKSAIGNVGTYSSESPDIRRSLRVAEDIKQMPNGVKAHQSIIEKSTAREEEGFIERLMKAISPEGRASFRQKAINRYEGQSVNDKKIADMMGGIELLADSSSEAAALQSDTAAGIAAAAMGYGDSAGGVPVYEKGYTTISDLNGTVKGLTEILRPLAAHGDPFIYRAYQFYAGVKRGTRLMADGKEKLFDQADIQYAKDLEQLYPEFKTVQQEWTKYNDGLVDYMVKTGVLTKEKGREFKKYGDYVPFYRQLEGEETIGPNIFQSMSNVKQPKKIKGGEAPLADFLETVVRNTQAAIQAGTKNVAAERAIAQALMLGTASKLPQVSSAPNTVTILENGVPTSYAVADKLLFDSMQSLHLPELPFLSILSGPANLLRNMVTKDPGFMLANLMRDSLSAYATSGAKMTPLVDTFSNFAKVMADRSPEFKALINAGVIGGYEFSRGVPTSGKALAKDLRKKTGTLAGAEKTFKPITSLWDYLEKGTEASDAATRIAVYKDVMARTGNEAEAIRQAAEVMNFNRKGSSPIVRVVTAAIPFLNARIQGLDVLYRAGFAPVPEGLNKTDRQREVQKNFFIRGATMMALSSMYWFMMKDDDEYKKQEQEVRDNNWLLPGLGVRIPIPFEVGVLFKVVPERILEFSFGNDTGEDLAKSMERALRSTFAVNYIPQTVLPLVEATTNYSYFTMRPIVGQGMENVRPGLQTGPGTTKIAQTVGKAINQSPIMIDHIIQGYTGTMGMYLVNAVDSIIDSVGDVQKPALRPDQYPIVKRFMINPEAKGSVSAYYELKDAVDETVRTMNLLEKTGRGEELTEFMQGKHRLFGMSNAKLYGVKGYISSVDKSLKELQDAATKIRASKMSPQEKQEALTQVNMAQIKLTQSVFSVKKNLTQ